MKTIAVSGLGSIGMRHAKNLISLGHKVMGRDPNETRFKELMEAGGYGWLDSINVIGYGGFDGVVIASPTPEHSHQLRVALDYGVNIFIEKPIMDRMGLDEHEISRLNYPCRAMVGYNLRFHSCVKKAKEWLDAGLIGKPIWSNFTLGQYNDRPPYLRDGVILNWSHEIDLCLYLLGGASLVASSTRITNDKDDMSDILLWHENDCRSTIHLDYITTPEHRYFTIAGDKGHLFINVKDRAASLMQGGAWTDFFTGTDTWNDNYIEEMQAFIDRIDGKETIGCSGEEGLEVLKICLEVRKQAGLE